MEIRQSLKNPRIWFLGFIGCLTISVIAVVLLTSSADQKLTPSPSVDYLISPSPSLMSNPEGKGDPGYQQEINQKKSEFFPLLGYLPIISDNFKITYNGPLSLEIILKTATESAKIQALDWIRSKGIDPSSHQIIYK